MFNEEGGKSYKGPVSQTPLDKSLAIAEDTAEMLKLCTDFSSSVLESVVLLFAEETLLEDFVFVDNIRALIQVCLLKYRETHTSRNTRTRAILENQGA